MQYPIPILLEDVKNFYQNYQKTTKSYFLPRQEHARRRYSRMEPEKIMALIIIYHLSGYRNFKIFYEEFAPLYFKRYFPNLISYSWFIRLRVRYMHAMLCYLMSKLQSSHEVSYIDSTCLKACHIRAMCRKKDAF